MSGSYSNRFASKTKGPQAKQGYRKNNQKYMDENMRTDETEENQFSSSPKNLSRSPQRELGSTQKSNIRKEVDSMYNVMQNKPKSRPGTQTRTGTRSSRQTTEAFTTESKSQDGKKQRELSRGKSKEKVKIPKKKLREEYSLEEIKLRIKKIFHFYSTFGDRTNHALLKSNKFNKMMADAGVKEVICNEDIDIIFCAENKHKPNMEYETFLNMLPKLAMEASTDAKKNKKDSLDNFIRDYLFPLYDKIKDSSEFGVDDEKIREPLDENIIMVLFSVHNVLCKIYQVYFPWEAITSDELKVVKQRTEKALFVFLKEFDLCPSLLTKSAVSSLWYELEDMNPADLTQNQAVPSIIPFLEKDVGTVLTYSKFLALISRIAIIAYEMSMAPKERKFSNAERLALLLERMELSPGMLNFQKKLCSTHNNKITLIVPRDILEKIIAGPEAPEEIITTSRKGRSDSVIEGSQMLRGTGENSMYEQSMDRGRRTESPGKIPKYTFDSDSAYEIFLKHKDPLQRIFQYYASFGEPMNHNSLKSIKFKKMMKESGLLQPKMDLTVTKSVDQSTRILEQNPMNTDTDNEKMLSQVDIDMVFCSLTGSKSQLTHNKTKGFDKKIITPSLGYHNHLRKHDSNNVQVNGKLDFEGFLKAIEKLAQRLFPDREPEFAINYILENHFIYLDHQIKAITDEHKPSMSGRPLQTLIDVLKDPEIVDFLGYVHKSLMIFYNFYADQAGSMNFESFVKFFKDFGIFPDIVPKGQMSNLFYTLAAVFANTDTDGPPTEETISQRPSTAQKKKAIEQTESELIDQHLFTEAIALCALDIPHMDPTISNVDKIIYLLERMNKSKGPSKVQRESGSTRPLTGAQWDLLFSIKKKYPQYFGYTGPLKPEKEDFDSLLS